MAKSRNDILFKYLADTKNLEKGNKRAKKGIGGVADVAKKAGGALALAFGAREVLQFGQDSIEAASDFEESINAVEVATGDAAAEIFKLGETAAQSLGLSKTEVNEAAVAFAAFGEKIDASDVAGTFDDFIGRATDFASVMNLETNDALQKFQSGLAGESEPLRRFGLDLSAASVNAFAYAEGIAATGTQLTEAEKVQARYGLLLQQTDKFAGDFENTSNSLANTQKRLTAEWKNQQVEIGKKLIPAYTDMLKITGKLMPVAVDALIKDLDLLTGTYEDLGKVISDVSNRDMPDAETAFQAIKGLAESLIPPLRLVDPALRAVGLAAKEAAVSTSDLKVHANELQGELAAIRGSGLQAKQGLDDAASGFVNVGRMALAARDGAQLWIDTIAGIPTGDMASRLADALAAGEARAEASRLAGIDADSPGQVRHGGGVVAGRPGQDVHTTLKAGERVTPRQQAGSGGGVVINFNGVVGDPAEVAQQIKDLLEFGDRVDGLG